MAIKKSAAIADLKIADLQILLLLDQAVFPESPYFSAPRSGWHLPALSHVHLAFTYSTGVAVTSQVLCTSITLNKGYCELFHIMAVSHPMNDSRTVSYTIQNRMSSGNHKKSPKTWKIGKNSHKFRGFGPFLYSQPTLSLNFCASFSESTRSITAPRERSFSSKFSYPRST